MSLNCIFAFFVDCILVPIELTRKVHIHMYKKVTKFYSLQLLFEYFSNIMNGYRVIL
jgi:hypothetical protein